MIKGIFMSVAATVALLASTMSSVSPEDAQKMLEEGNKRFLEGKATRPNISADRIKETSKGQKPFVTVNSCSDSRVPVEILFDRGFGDIFVIRNAGNVSDTDEAGTIEYGTEHLGTRLVVIMGHTKCGAVTAVAKGDHVEGNIPALVDNIIPAVKKVKAAHKDESHDKWIDEAIKENVWQSIEDLYTKSSIVRHLSKEGKVKVIGALYDVDSGAVKFLGEHPKTKELIQK